MAGSGFTELLGLIAELSGKIGALNNRMHSVEAACGCLTALSSRVSILEEALQAARDELQLHVPNGRELELANEFVTTSSHAMPLERQIAELLAEYRVELTA